MADEIQAMEADHKLFMALDSCFCDDGSRPECHRCVAIRGAIHTIKTLRAEVAEFRSRAPAGSKDGATVRTCIVKDCANTEREGNFKGDLCCPCYNFVAGLSDHYCHYSQAYHNVIATACRVLQTAHER